MHNTRSLALLAALLLSDLAACSRPGRRDDAPRVVSLRTRKILREPGLTRRDDTNGTVDVGLDNRNLIYTVEISMGTPPQIMILQLDTGSADLWVPAASFCADTTSRHVGNVCEEAGSYSANDSSTYEYLNSDFFIGYVDKSETAGDFATDVLTIGNVTVPDMQFGIGYNNTGDSFTGGIIGISYTADESTGANDNNKPYPNFPAVLVRDGLIQSRAYSLYLDSLDSREGTILFGGIDTTRFEGQLQTLPVVPTDGAYTNLQIALTDVSIAGSPSLGPGSGDAAIPALLDSGTSFAYIPDDIVFSLYDTFDATYDKAGGNAYVACSLSSQDSPIIFSFSGVNISLSMSEMVLDAKLYAEGGSETGKDGVCAFGLLPMSAMSLSAPILGDTFLRSAYIVYDLDNNEISLAQAAYDNSEESNIVEIGSGPSAVPEATGTGTSTGSGSGSGSGGGGTPNSGDGNAAAALVPTTFGLWAVALLHTAVLGLAIL